MQQARTRQSTTQTANSTRTNTRANTAIQSTTQHIQWSRFGCGMATVKPLYEAGLCESGWLSAASALPTFNEGPIYIYTSTDLFPWRCMQELQDRQHLHIFSKTIKNTLLKTQSFLKSRCSTSTDLSPRQIVLHIYEIILPKGEASSCPKSRF